MGTWMNAHVNAMEEEVVQPARSWADTVVNGIAVGKRVALPDPVASVPFDASK